MFSALDILDVDLSQETTPVSKPAAFRPKLNPRGPKGAGPSAPKRTSASTKKAQKLKKSQPSDSHGQVNDTQPQSQVSDVLNSPTKQSVQEVQLQKEPHQNSRSSQCVLEVDLSQPQSQVCNVSQSPTQQSVDVLTQEESLQLESTISLVVQLDDSQPQSQVCDTSGASHEQQVHEPFPQLSQVEETSSLGFPLDDEYLVVDLGSSPNHTAYETQKDDEQMDVDKTSEKESERSSESPVTQAEMVINNTMEEESERSSESPVTLPEMDINKKMERESERCPESPVTPAETGIYKTTEKESERSSESLFTPEELVIDRTMDKESPLLCNDESIGNESPQTKPKPTYHRRSKRNQDEDSFEPGSSESYGRGYKKNPDLLENEEALETNTTSPAENLIQNEEPELDTLIEAQGKSASSSKQPRKKRKVLDIQQNSQHENEENVGVHDPPSNGKRTKNVEVQNSSGAQDMSNVQVNECLDEAQNVQLRKSKRFGKNVDPATSPTSAKKSRKKKSLQSLTEAPSDIDVRNALDGDTGDNPVDFTTSPSRAKMSRKMKSSGSLAEPSTQVDAGNADAPDTGDTPVASTTSPSRAKNSRKMKSSEPLPEPSIHEDAPDTGDNPVASTTSPKRTKRSRKMKSSESLGDPSTQEDAENADSPDTGGNPVASNTSPKRAKKSRKKSSGSLAEASTQEDAGNKDGSDIVKKSRKMKSPRSSGEASNPFDAGNTDKSEATKKSRQMNSPKSSAGASNKLNVGNADTSDGTKKSRNIKPALFSVEASAHPDAGNDDVAEDVNKSRKTRSPKVAARAASELSSGAGQCTKEDQGKKKLIKPLLHRRKVDRRALNPADPDLDPKKMTIRDIIRLAEAKERMMKHDEAKKSKLLREGAATTIVQEEEVEETTNFAPQVQIVDGRIVINQESLTVTAHKRDDFRSYRRVEETHSKLNYHSYMKKTPRVSWRSDETDLFYKALREFGTNFAMIQHLFPGRSRKQILLKYKKEERCSPLRVAEAMTLKAKGCTQYMEVINMMNIVPIDEQDNPEESADFDMTSNQEEVDSLLPSTMEPESEVVGNDEDDEVKEEEKENGRTLDGAGASRQEADANNAGPKPESPKPEEPKEESQASKPVVPKKRSLFSYQATTVT